MSLSYGTGTWGTPELGITELFGGKKNSIDFAKTYGSGQIPQTNQFVQPTAPQNTTQYGPAIPGDFSSLYKPAPSGIDNTIDYAKQLEKQRQAEEDAARAKILSQTRRAYDPFFSDLARQEAEIPGIQNEYMGVMNQGYQNQADIINRGQMAGLQQAEASKGEIKTNQARSLRDLASNLSSAVNAFGQRLGQAGAGDSSAANVANFAFSKLANKNTADVMSQVRTQLAQVEQAKISLVNDAKDKLSALETWKANQTLSISQYVRTLRDYVNKARAQGKQALAQDEVDSIKEGFARAQERLMQINDLAVTSRMQIIQNAQSALADAQAYSQKLTLMGDTNPTPVEAAPVDEGSIDNSGAVSMVPQGAIDTTEDKGLWDVTLPNTTGGGGSW